MDIIIIFSTIIDYPGNTLLPGNSEGCFILNSVNSKIYEGSSANSFIEHRMPRNGIVRRISK